MGNVHIATLQPANGAHGELHNGRRGISSSDRRGIQSKSTTGIDLQNMCDFRDSDMTLLQAESVYETKVQIDSYITDNGMFTCIVYIKTVGGENIHNGVIVVLSYNINSSSHVSVEGNRYRTIVIIINNMDEFIFIAYIIFKLSVFMYEKAVKYYILIA